MTLAASIAALAVPTAAAGAVEAESPVAPAADDAEVAAPSRALGSTVARVVAASFGRFDLDEPRRGKPVRRETSWSAQPQVLLVLDSASVEGRGWVKVLLGSRPDGSAGWIPRDNVVLERTPYWVDVDVGSRSVSVYRDGRRVRRFRAVVGAAATPTPLGLAAIYERNRQPDPGAFFGPWVLSLTSFSSVLHGADVGFGRTGIHGRSGASLLDPLGTARSNGCIRLDNGAVSWLAARLPAGTPVQIRR